MRSARWNAEYVSWKNEGFVTVKDHEILTALDRESDYFWKGIHLTQGGLSSSVAASASTHNGLGAFDIRTRYNTKPQVWELAAMLNRSGIVAFPRGYNLGSWDPFRNVKHIHAVSRESYNSLHPSAKSQYQEFDRGGDGLVGSAKYTGPKVPFGRWRDSPYNPANITEDTATYYVKVGDGFLWGLDVDRNKKASRENGRIVIAAKRIQRWGRSNIVDSGGLYWAAEYLTAEETK
jgi:hypothetical protein